MADPIPLLGGDVRKVKFRLTEDSYFKCTFRYRVKNEDGTYVWTDFPVDTDLKIIFPNPVEGGDDFLFPVTSIEGQYARFIIAPTLVNPVLEAEAVHGQLWFDDGTGFDLAASGAVVDKE